MNVEDLRLRYWYGEGYYSGQSSIVILFYDINDKEFLENNCKEFNREEVYLGELDGKHSAVYGKCQGDLSNIFEIVNICKESDDNLFYNLNEKNNSYELLEKAKNFFYKLSIEKQYKVKSTGEIFDYDDIEIIQTIKENE